jgi:hypothetical protein
VTVWLHVKNLTTEVAALKVKVVLNGLAATQQPEFTQKLGELAVKIRRGDVGKGDLQITLFGLSPDRCKVAMAHVGTELRPDQNLVEAEVSLGRLPAKLCTLTVERSEGGRVVSDAAGIDCGATCEADFPVGTNVKLTATMAGKSFFADWGQTCVGRRYRVIDECVVSMQKSQHVRVELTPAVCSPSNWCQQNPQSNGATLQSVWGADAKNVWAVGDGGTIVKWNGSAWSAQPSGTSKDLYGVWGSDASNVWAVGDGGTIVKWNGSAWSAQPSGTSKDLYGVWGSDASNVWAVGYSGTILFYEPLIQ